MVFKVQSKTFTLFCIADSEEEALNEAFNSAMCCNITLENYTITLIDPPRQDSQNSKNNLSNDW